MSVHLKLVPFDDVYTTCYGSELITLKIQQNQFRSSELLLEPERRYFYLSVHV